MAVILSYAKKCFLKNIITYLETNNVVIYVSIILQVKIATEAHRSIINYHKKRAYNQNFKINTFRTDRVNWNKGRISSPHWSHGEGKIINDFNSCTAIAEKWIKN